MYNSIEDAIEDARTIKAKYGYTVPAVIVETQVSRNKFSVGFHFSENEPVGFKGVHASGDAFEVMAVIS